MNLTSRARWWGTIRGQICCYFGATPPGEFWVYTVPFYEANNNERYVEKALFRQWILTLRKKLLLEKSIRSM